LQPLSTALVLHDGGKISFQPSQSLVTCVLLIQTTIPAHNVHHFSDISAADDDDDDDDDADDEYEKYIHEDETRRSSADTSSCYLVNCSRNRCKHMSPPNCLTTALNTVNTWAH